MNYSQKNIISTLLFLLSFSSYAIDIEKSDYKITVPDKSTVDPAEPDIDLDTYTTINLPNGNILIVYVVHNKPRLDTMFNYLKNDFISDLEKHKISKSTSFQLLKGDSIIINGVLNAQNINFELGKFSGNTKGYIVVNTYLDSEKRNAQKILKGIIESFKIKS